MNENYPDEIVAAWNEFKGSRENSTVSEARTVLDTVETARTTKWEGVDAVVVYTDPDVDIPDAVTAIINRNNLVQIGEQQTTNHLTMYFTTRTLAQANNLSTAEDMAMETSPV